MAGEWGREVLRGDSWTRETQAEGRSVTDCWNRKEQSPHPGSGVSEGTRLEMRPERQGEARSRSTLRISFQVCWEASGGTSRR